MQITHGKQAAILKAVLAAMLVGGTLSVNAATSSLPTTPATSDDAFSIAHRYPLPGAEKWDYVAYDAVRHHLFISRATHVQVMDTKSGKQVGDIANTDGVHGFAFVQRTGLGFITNGKADTITVINLHSLKTIDTIKAGGADPDGILYVPKLNLLFTSNGHANSVSVIDPSTRKILSTIAVGGKLEALAADAHGNGFVAIEDKGEIVEFDPKAGTLLKHWPLTDCTEPSGLAIDAQTSRLFTVCANNKMSIVDAHTGEQITQMPIGGHPDAAAFDERLKLIFSSNGKDGTLTVVHEDTPQKYTVLQNLRTEEGARTMALDDAGHRVFLVTSRMQPAPAASSGDSLPPPQIVPNTFNVLVAERSH